MSNYAYLKADIINTTENDSTEDSTDNSQNTVACSFGQVKKEDCNNCVCSNSGEWVCEDNICDQASVLESESNDQTGTIIILIIALIFISITSVVLFLTNKNRNSEEHNIWFDGNNEEDDNKKKVKMPPLKPPKSE